jgi:DNA helicase-2/ATP-dependent DNA helicase PcrA
LKDTAVFYRTNAQSRTLEDAFRDSGIPYVIVGGLRFYERREIKDVLAYLRVLVNPADTVSLFRIINTPRRGIGEKTITALAAFAEQRTLSPFEALVHIDKIGTVSQREMTSLLAFRSLMQELAQGPADADIVGYVKEVIKKTGYLEWLGTSAEEDASDRIDNVSELVNAVREYCERNESPTLQGFLEEVALLTDIDVVREEEMQVATLMTLHASKGLEFDHVFIAGLEDGLFPIARAEEADDIEEERRLFYVGLTRARKRAYLFHSVCRYRFGSVTSAMASPFLDELPEPCIRKIDKTNASPAPRSRHDARSRIDVQTDFLPDYENYSQTKGQRVYHPIWGEGTIIAISGISDNLKATIQFETSVKKVMVKYAKLEVVQS